MSTKSTILHTSFCHIYRDIEFNGDVEKLCIDVNYDYVDEYESIEVLWDSDFAKMILFMLDNIDHSKLESMFNNYHFCGWIKEGETYEIVINPR